MASSPIGSSLATAAAFSGGRTRVTAVLDPAEAYRLWAPTYSSETAISQIEDDLVERLTPQLDSLRLLDAACGTGRRLQGTRAAEAVGIDSSEEMLEARDRRLLDESRVRFLVGDLASLPVGDQSFDLAWCRLAIGHVRDCAAVYSEVARAVRIGGTVIVTDFHPAAAAAGHKRTFRDGRDVFEVEHHVHAIEAHRAASAAAGLETIATLEGRIDARVEHFYAGERGRRLFAEQFGLPVVLALSFRRIG